jgi:ADP-ribose pyrophosphatase YjhB (NUDIX family)
MDYTIGAIFIDGLEQVLLINKLKPAWQAGLKNLPGGKKEPGENFEECISRKIMEECNLYIEPNRWMSIGTIMGEDYNCILLTAMITLDESRAVKSMEAEQLEWANIFQLPMMCISNLYWLVPYAWNWWNQGNYDSLQTSVFMYGTDKHKFTRSAQVPKRKQVLDSVQRHSPANDSVQQGREGIAGSTGESGGVDWEQYLCKWIVDTGTWPNGNPASQDTINTARITLAKFHPSTGTSGQEGG